MLKKSLQLAMLSNTLKAKLLNNDEGCSIRNNLSGIPFVAILLVVKLPYCYSSHHSQKYSSRTHEPFRNRQAHFCLSVNVHKHQVVNYWARANALVVWITSRINNR